ncbi:reverse transcriptase domain-containing protein [Clostridium oryzae]|uniref:Group II intron-encoded protein LtrA n=1 Tax=Clostridium oryzae TaxID=1450648 RepID=A0A1V4ICI7_9CLOT|nr:reverse transcriptase domain-containing protein [Clostridium oryzae]OPJ57345.1 group II intron-encoded protein LtrA [Clostridium oryzae]
MRNPVTILNTLKSNSNKEPYRFRRLHRLFYNRKMFLLAYNNIYSSQGNMTPGIDGRTIDQMTLDRLDTLITKLKSKEYKPTPVMRKYIPKKNGKLRTLGIPCIEDKLVQEVIRMTLESVWEDTFYKSSHGFRDGKSCHTALLAIKETFTGSKWFIEGDIKTFFDNIDHEVLVSILRRRIDDEYFIQIIVKFLKAGYMEYGANHISYSGTAQGSLISPILSNIYLNEFDAFIKSYSESFNKGKTRKRNPEYHRLDARKQHWVSKLRNTNPNSDEYSHIKNEIKQLSKTLLNSPHSDPIDENYRRMVYVRYADDFLVGIIGSKADAYRAKADFKNFMNNQLKLELSEEKTLITHSAKRVRFLGYDIRVIRNNNLRKDKTGRISRRYNGIVKLYLPTEIWKKKLLELSVMHIQKSSSKTTETWRPNSRNQLINNKDENIIKQFNSEVRGLYNYYQLACNVSYGMHKFNYFMYYSCLRTLAKKHRCRMKAIRIKFDVEGYFKVGNTFYYHEGFHTKKFKFKDIYKDLDIITKYKYPFGKYSPAFRVKSGYCELCGASHVRIVMHHVRTLKGLSPDTPWNKLMLKMYRKSIALCDYCNKSVLSS